MFRNPPHPLLSLIQLAGILLLSACGGGGGGGGGGGTGSDSYTVSATAGAGGSISPASTSVNSGETATLTLTPDSGYHIDTVSGCGGSLSGNSYTTGAVTVDCSVTASFALDTFTVSASAGAGGGISPATSTVAYGGTTTLTLTPAANYHVDTVAGCGGTLSGSSYTTGTITADCSVTASFAIDSFTVSTQADGGTLSPASVSVDYGSSTSLTLTPDAGRHIGSVSGCGGSLSGDTYTTGAITAGCTVAALFSADAFTLANQGLDKRVLAVAKTSDGSGDIYVGGDFTSFNGTVANRIVRLNSDGTIDTDTAFNSNVVSGFDQTVFTIAEATDGSHDLYVGGSFNSYNGTSSMRIIRLNADGTLDSGFDVSAGGIDMIAFTISPADDGSGDIYVGGSFSSYNGDNAIGKHIIRLNSDGSVEATFDTGGASGSFDNSVWSIVPVGNGTGDIYAGGAFSTYKGVSANHIARLKANGSLDPAFVSGTGFNGTVSAITVADDASGDIYAGGFFSDYNGSSAGSLARLNSNGSIDTGFATGSGFDSRITNLAMVGDGTGDLYVGGDFTAFNGGTVNRLIRLQNDGSLNTGFAASGLDSYTRAIVPLGDGSGEFYLAGLFTRYNGTANTYLVRLAGDGSISQAYADHAGFNDRVTDIAASTDGSGDIYVAGLHTVYDATDSGGLARLNSDGTADGAFVTGSGFNAITNTVVMANDGSGDLYVGGAFTSYNGTASNYLIRLNSDGSVDTDYGTLLNNRVYTIAPALDGSGDVYVGGDFSGGVVRLNTDGTVDTGFTPVGSGFDSTVITLLPAADGSGDVYVGGDFVNYGSTAVNFLVRLNDDGSIDTAFNTGSGLSGDAISLASAADGSGDIYAGGTFSNYNGNGVGHIIRLNSDGSLDTDTGFNSNIGNGFNGTVDTIALTNDGSGDLYVGGAYFNAFNATPVGRIARLNNNGTLDSSFAAGAGNGFTTGGVATIITDADNTGAVYVGGNFTSYQNTTALGIISLNPDGSVD